MTFTTRWIKTGKVHDFIFLGKEVIATACGYHIVFYNLVTKEERIEYFNSPSRGEGACCLAGHQIMPIFSTSERRFCPKIYIHTFPELKKVAVCKLDTGPSSYLSCCFTGTEYLVSLTSYPLFELIIWQWRTGEKIHSVQTALTDSHQIIESSIHSSQLIYQFSPRSGKLWTHEIHTYSKKVMITQNFIKINGKKIVSVHWMNSGNLFLIDTLQNVYIAGLEGKKCQLILSNDFDGECMNNFSILPLTNSFFIVDNNSKLSFYSKSCPGNNISECWNPTWSVECKSHPLKMVLARHKEAILIHCQNGEILELDLGSESNPKLECIYKDCRKITNMCTLEPDRVYITAIDCSNCLHVIDVLKGTISHSYIIEKNDQGNMNSLNRVIILRRSHFGITNLAVLVVCMVSHPHIPLLVASTSTGKVMYFIKSDKNFMNFEISHLQREPLEKIKFSRTGSIVGTSSNVSKYFFMLKTVLTEKIDVFFYKKFDKCIIDFLIFENGQTIRLLILLQTLSTVNVSDSIEVYTIQKWDNVISNRRIIFTNHCYKHLDYCPEKYGDFIGSPYLSKQINFFQFEDDFQSINLCDIIVSTHKMRVFQTSTSNEYLSTGGSDGLIVLRSFSDAKKVIRTYTAHHHKERGTKSAVVSVNHNRIISLGSNGSILCILLGQSESGKLTNNAALFNYEDVRNFVRLHKDMNVSEKNERLVWIEHENLKIAEEEKNKVRILKNSILKQLHCLKEKVKLVVDLNKMKSIECQAPISAFDLNFQMRKEKVHFNLTKQEAERERLQRVISQKEEIINYLIQQFWHAYEVHDCTLKSFDSDIVVKNYRLRHINKPEMMDDFFIELFDIQLLNQSMNCNGETVDDKINDIITDARSSPESIEKGNAPLFPEHINDVVLSGSTSFRYINDKVLPNQLTVLGFDNINSQSSREYRLKVHFNNKFNEILCLKNKVINETRQRLKDLNVYRNELHETFGIILENPYSTVESKWLSDESPANIITSSVKTSLTNNQSITIQNYTDQNTSQDLSNSIDYYSSTLSPHEQIFREEKLNEMMDGLLEIRWEDEIKKEVPKPHCLVFKHPSKYNDEDIKAIAAYKLKVEKLRLEREKYRTHLESQIQCINDAIKVDVEKFDSILEKFSLEKIKVQSAILQEFLLRLNNYKQKFLKEYESKKVLSVMYNDLASLENETKMLVNEVLKIEPVVVELRNKYDNLNKRDKTLETKFKSEFGDLKQPLVEHLLRQYKKRPKISQISCTSLTCLTETNKCLVTGNNSPLLPQEYLEFLKGMDTLDIMPNSLPPQIDSNHWQLLCKLRRNKVEMEIKLKIAALELAESEQTYIHLQKLSSLMQSKIYLMKNSVEGDTLKQSKFYSDSPIQLILKSGQIEIFLTGSMKDLEIAIVVSYDHLIQTNFDIIEEGQRKIAAMQAEIFVRKSILYRRWKYQCMSMKLKHCQEQLVVLHNIKIGRDMQNYLVERLEKNVHYKDATSSGKILNSIRKKFQRMLKDEKTVLGKILKEASYWREENAELARKIQLCDSLKQHQKFELEETHLQKRNRSFHKHSLRAIMERTSLVKKLKDSRNELLNLQTQLELLKLKTYPTLRHKDICHHRSDSTVKSS